MYGADPSTWTTAPMGADHSRSCSIFTGWHERSKDGRPGPFRPVPCDCGAG